MLQGIRETSLVQNYPIGMRYAEGDRVFRYCRADEALPMNPALGAANADTLHFMNSAVAALAGATQITVVIDPADGNYALNQFRDGYISIHTAPIQRCLKIRGNPVDDGTNVILYLAEALLADVPLPTFLEIHENKYHSIELMNAVGRQSVVCVPPVPVAINEYFWGQTWGECLCAASHGGGIGGVNNECNVFFQDDGSIGCGTDLPPATGFQFAGYIVPRTERLGAAADSIHFCLCLAP